MFATAWVQDVEFFAVFAINSQVSPDRGESEN